MIAIVNVDNVMKMMTIFIKLHHRLTGVFTLIVLYMRLLATLLG